MVWGFENLLGMGDDPPPPPPLLISIVNQNRFASISQIVYKSIIKLMTSLLVPCNYVIFYFGVKVQPFTKFSIFGEIKLKFGGGVNSETLISCFMSIVPKK